MASAERAGVFPARGLTARAGYPWTDWFTTGGPWRRSIVYLGLFVGLVSLLFNVWDQHPGVVRALSTKGTPADLTGPIVLLVGALVGLSLARRWRTRRLRSFWPWLGYASLLWLLGMEEMGWGHDVLRFPRPEIEGIAVDSIHDLLRLLKKMRTGEVALLFKATGGLMVGGLLALLATRVGRSLLRAVNVSIALLILLGAGSIFAATILDVRVTDVFWFLRHRPPYELEEGLEIIGEVMLALVVVEGWLCHRAATKRSSDNRYWPVPVAARPVPAVGSD